MGCYVGVDGCRAGWVIATLSPGQNRPDLRVIPTLDALSQAARRGEIAAIGIDIPIGLPDAGPREADRQLRAFLGNRSSSVFPTPPRALIDPACIADYDQARLISMRVQEKSISKQTYFLLPKIAEADHFVRTVDSARVTEVHPESAFLMMAEGQALRHSKKTPAGRDERRRLLQKVEPDWQSGVPSRLVGAAPDDVYDALAALWSTARWQAGTARTFGSSACDATGLAMLIRV